ncbi:stalk domain-containing protein [Niameybacter sp.]|uniref:stalk domain-containing protein n=1 Tax=Niameybacter sp. TaxID=2033640 RepID=UPI002FC5B4FE
MKRKLALWSVLVLAISTLFGTVWAANKLSPIKASLNTDYKYTYNGKQILKNVPAIIYNNMVYVPVYNLTKELGYNVNVTQSETTLSLPEATKPPTKPTEPTDTVTIDKAQIIAINFADHIVTVVPAGKSKDMANQIDLKITPETTIQSSKDKKNYKLSDLNTGINVKVVHSAAQTKSIPPQTVAYSITLL